MTLRTGDASDSGSTDVRITIAVPGHDPKLPPPNDAEFDAAKLEFARIERELHDLREALARVGRLNPGPRR